MMTYPILYSFRRCPYAMRARMALKLSGVSIELREVSLKNKPQQMLLISPKSTVPVLQLADQTVIDESLDIMYWALGQDERTACLLTDNQLTTSLIQLNDNEFKSWLDKYKYADRYPEYSAEYYRSQAEPFLRQLNTLLAKTKYLQGDKITVLDIAILPFIRQFAYVDIGWFENSSYQHLVNWMFAQINAELFTEIMHKQPYWDSSQEPIFL